MTGASGRLFARLGDMLAPLDGNRVEAVGAGDSWTDGLVYFEFAAGITDVERQAFLDDVSVWSAVSAVQFVESSDAGNRILVQKVAAADAEGCGDSAVGMIGGVQDLHVTDTCWSRRVIVHEMGHALGLLHEQVRSDRDAFLSVVDEDDMASRCPTQFTVNWGIQDAPKFTAYDFASVMHYPRVGCLNCIDNQPSLCVRLDAKQAQPPGDPPGSETACTDAASCDAIMGAGSDASARDRLGLAIRYGQRLNYTIEGDGTGSVGFAGAIGTCAANCVIAPHDATLTVIATPAAGSVASIAGACAGSTSCDAAMGQNRTARVRFVRATTAVSAIFLDVRSDVVFANGFQ